MSNPSLSKRINEVVIAEATAESKLLATAKRRYSESSEAFNEFNKEARDVLKFFNGDQWDYQLKNNRENAGLPCITTNVLPSYVRQITNESRKNCPSIQIDPKGSGASKELAEIYADMIRGIEQHSNANTVYDTAGYLAATIGLGFIRVVSEYESPESFHQKLVLKQVDDSETVLLDPNHRNMDGSDSEYAFILSSMSKEEYQRSFPDTKLGVELTNERDFSKIKATGWTSNTAGQWIRENEVIIAEYYYKDYVPKTLYQVFNTTTGATIESMEEPNPELVKDGTLIVVNSRPTHEVQIKWAKLNDREVLEETSWPGKYIPIAAVKGSEIWVNGERKIKGAVVDAIDSQRAFNYFSSVAAELVSLAPKAPFIGEIRQFANFEHLWRDSNVSSISYLPYNAITEGGQMLPPPMRQVNETPIQAAMELCSAAQNNIKAVFGVFDAAMGSAGPEQSAKAILSRVEQSHNTNYHFYDNLTKSIAHIGTLLVEAIPTYYREVGREIQLIKQSGQASNVVINSNDKTELSRGNFGVVVETGPSYATRRQDSVSHMITLASADPAIMHMVADLICEASDWPGAGRIAKRLRTLLPPEIQQEEMANGDGGSEQVAAQAVAQVKQLTAQLQQVTQQHQQADQLLHQAMSELKLVKDKSSFEVMKAQQDHALERDKLMLSEAESELEFKIKLAELDLERQQLELERAKIGISGAKAMSEMAGEMHDRAINHHERPTDMEVITPVIPKAEVIRVQGPGTLGPGTLGPEDTSGFNMNTLEIK